MPGPACKVCTNRRSRKQIDRLLLRHVPVRAIAAKFGTSPSTLCRHRRHLDAALVRDAEAKEIAYVGGLVEEYAAELETLQSDVRWAQRDAKKRGKLDTMLKAVREARENVLAKARLTGALSERAPHQELHLHLDPERALAVAEAYTARHRQVLEAANADDTLGNEPNVPPETVPD